jgi:hypothetical protein
MSQETSFAPESYIIRHFTEGITKHNNAFLLILLSITITPGPSWHILVIIPDTILGW